MLNTKKARLVEHNMSYEDLQEQPCFSDEELTFSRSRASLK